MKSTRATIAGLIVSVVVVLGTTLAGCQRGNAPAPVAAAAPPPPAQVDAARLTAAAADGANWMTTGRTYDEQRFSPLKQVSAANVAQLKLAWHHDLDAVQRGQEATPIVVDGVMYVSTAWSKVFALDAKTGRKLWGFDPQVPGSWGINPCCDAVNRGVAVWNGKVYVGTLDGRLIALDAATGKPVWDVLTIDPSKRYSITGAPRVIKGKVIIGNGGAELGVRGYVSAYDAESGKMLWRFYTVPGDPSEPFESPALAQAAKTWHGEWWKNGGGGTVWDAMAYDPQLDLLYIGVGNGSPWSRELRSPGGGDNLYLSSIVALKADTGEYAWHFQTTPGDAWDFTATQQMILADLPIGGKTRQVIMQAPKNGFFYVLDRATGEFLSGKPFATLNWATGLDKNGRPIENPAARYDKTGKPWVNMPGPGGAHSWHSMSFSQDTGLVYIPVLELSFPYIAKKNDKPSKFAFFTGADFLANSMPQDPKIRAGAIAASKGHLLAWDPVAQKEVWRAQYNEPWNGGALSTAGNLVFQGTAMGELIAYQADTGAKLWSSPTQTGVIAAPVTYEVDGTQYVAIEVGYGGAFAVSAGEIASSKHPPTNVPRVLVYALTGNDSLPPPPPAPARILQPPPASASAAEVQRGKGIYHPYCSNCHGDAAVSGSFLPDLRYSALLQDPAAWQKVVHDGGLQHNGMVAFAAELSEADIEAVRSYVTRRAHDALAEQNSKE